MTVDAPWPPASNAYWYPEEAITSMRTVLLTVSVIFGSSALAADDPVNAARRLEPSVKWDAASLVRADVTCDGKADGILLGRDNSTVWVAVISSDKPEANRRNLMQFALGPGTQAALCALPATIETYPIECETESGPLEGCKPSSSCRGFSVVDGQCDSLHFYWHSGRKRIVWWRR